jgi:hypothetical protein
MITITMHASYEAVRWEGEDEEPIVAYGLTDPSNPWGGFSAEQPEGLHGPDAARWHADHVMTETFDNLIDAAQFVVDFPGAVWDMPNSYCEPNIDYGSGEETTVMLHVDGPWSTAIFTIAAAMQRHDDRTRRRTMAAAGW